MNCHGHEIALYLELSTKTICTGDKIQNCLTNAKGSFGISCQLQWVWFRRNHFIDFQGKCKLEILNWKHEWWSAIMSWRCTSFTKALFRDIWKYIVMQKLRRRLFFFFFFACLTIHLCFTGNDKHIESKLDYISKISSYNWGLVSEQ